MKMNLSEIDFLTGDGVPTMPATKGSIYVNLGGTGVADRLYIADTASTWTAVSTVA
jgi:hypothetical protein